MRRLPPMLCGRPLAGDAFFAPSLPWFWIKSFKSFRAPMARESLFSVWPEKSNPKRGHPAWRLPPIPGRQVREPEPGFSAAHPCAVEKASASCRCPLRGLIDSDSPPHRGPEERAGHSWPALGARRLRRREQRREAMLPAFRGVRAGCAPAFRGPLCGGEGRTRRPEGGSTGMSSLFRPDRSPAEKPGRPSRTFRAGSPESAKRGAPLFGYFLSGKREKVTRPPQEDESSCFMGTYAQAIASPTSECLRGRAGGAKKAVPAGGVNGHAYR